MTKKIKLTIVVPYFNETEREIFPLLSSIQNQAGVDFSNVEIILVNDGGKQQLSKPFLNLFFNLQIQILCLDENRGPGVARQDGLDNAQGDYVMFCDADDSLHSVGVLGMFLAEADAGNADIITSQWLEELIDPATGRYTYINHEDEATWMHGKMFRRAFLQERNIRFHESLRIHEDSYFLALAFELAEQIRKLSVTTYLWRFTAASITRRDNALYTYQSMPVFLEALCHAFRQLAARKPEKMQEKVVQLLLYIYFTLHQDHWQLQEVGTYLKATEQACKDLLKEFLCYLQEADAVSVRRLYNQERDKSFSLGMENESFCIWISRIFQCNCEKF